MMKKTTRFLSMAAIVLVGAVMTGCSSDDNGIADEQPSTKPTGTVTLTTTISRDGDGGTSRALTANGVKTFAVGEQLAVVYVNTSGATVKAVSNALTSADITDGKQATFTFTLENPDRTKDVTYIYPAAMANADGTPNYGLLSTQNGTLETLASTLDYATVTAAWNGSDLPAATLTNQLAILAVTLKNTTDITATITNMTLSDGTNNYTVNRSTAAGPIYVAIRPTTSANISITATDRVGTYTKTLTDKTYKAGNGYSVSWLMAKNVDLSKLEDHYTAQNGDVLTGKLGGEYDNYEISIADGATVTLDGVTINGTNSGSYRWAGITCLGDATIILSGTNNVKGFHDNYPGIYVPRDKTLTIQGDGSLTASSNGAGAGIGGGFNLACGNIVIEGGTIEATGGNYSAGIGGGNGASWGNITIKNTVTSVTATKGENALHSIGAGGNGGDYGTVTIGGVTGPIDTSPYTYTPQQ